jgi:ribulose-5-phosphate 4-epimerase/fuculose-1-phosphate aldolase
MNSEGYIKFNCIRSVENIRILEKYFQQLSKWRQIMHEIGLIGVYSNGVGYGNLSIRADSNSFYISGTATGRFSVLEEKHFALVNSWSYKQNSLQCTGMINASAESLSHAAIYETLSQTGAVIHVHHKGMWDKYINSKPATSTEVSYGSPEMALEIQKVIQKTDSHEENFLVMGGHEEGIITWGNTLDEAGEIILKHYKSFLEG